MSKQPQESTLPTTLFVFYIDALSPEMLTHLALTFGVESVGQGSTCKHGFSFVRLKCFGEPPEALLEYFDNQMNVLDYAIEGKSVC